MNRFISEVAVFVGEPSVPDDTDAVLRPLVAACEWCTSSLLACGRLFGLTDARIREWIRPMTGLVPKLPVVVEAVREVRNHRTRNASRGL